MLPVYFYTACIPDGLQLYMKVSDCLDRYSSQTVHRIRTLSWERILFLSAVFYTEESVSARWLLSLWLWLASCSLHPGTHSLSGCRIFPAVFCTLQRMRHCHEHFLLLSQSSAQSRVCRRRSAAHMQSILHVLTCDSCLIPDLSYSALFSFVERHIKYTKKIKLNAKRNIVKFNSIQFI